MRNSGRKHHKRTMAMLLTGVLLISGLAACQQTPIKKTVMQKDQEQMLKTAGSLEDRNITVKEQIQAPEKSQFSFSDSVKRLSVTADAEIILPEAEQIPIIQVEARKLDQKDVDVWVDYFFGDETLYSIDSVSNFTKEEYQEIQLQYKKELADKEAQLAAGNLAQEEALNDRIKELQSWIQSLDYDIESAPETSEKIQVDSTIQDGPGAHIRSVGIASPSLLRGGYKSFNYRETNYSEEDLYSAIWYADRGDKYTQGYDRGIVLLEDMEDEWNLLYAGLPDVKMTREEAIELGNEAVKILDLDGNLSLNACQKGVIDYSGYDHGKGMAESALKVWNLEYVMGAEGISVPYSDLLIEVALSESSVSWPYKSLNLMIDDRGIIQADLNGPCEIKETLVENCKLLPYESIIEIFQKMILLGEGWLGTSKVLSGEAQVNQVQLQYARISSCNQVGVGMLVPAWFFYGNRSVMLEELDQPYGGVEGLLMVINAIDGSVINLNNGY